MRRFLGMGILSLALFSVSTSGASHKSLRQVGIGFGTASTYPISNYPHAVTVALEGSYRKHFYGISILATATSSPLTEGTYWFGSNGSFQQTFLEPRLYLSVFRIGLALGLNLSSGSSGDIQSVACFGPMAGVEIPIRSFSLGLDARYLYTSTGSLSAPLSTLLVFRYLFK